MHACVRARAPACERASVYLRAGACVSILKCLVILEHLLIIILDIYNHDFRLCAIVIL